MSCHCHLTDPSLPLAFKMAELFEMKIEEIFQPVKPNSTNVRRESTETAIFVDESPEGTHAEEDTK